MQYLEEMTTKWGFSDGEVYPPFVEMFREMYIKAINAFAEKNGSEYRVVAWNRAGMHNFCLIYAMPANQFNNLSSEEKYEDGPQTPENKENVIGLDDVTDKLLIEAIENAEELHVDDYVRVTCYCEENDMLESIKSFNFTE